MLISCIPLTCHRFLSKHLFPHLKNREKEFHIFVLFNILFKFYCHDICTIVQYGVKRTQVAFVLPHDEASISASGLHVV